MLALESKGNRRWLAYLFRKISGAQIMGGFGSGRHASKGTTGELFALDIRKLQRDGLLTPGHAFVFQWSRHGETLARINIRTGAGLVDLIYRHGGDAGQDMNYPVAVDWTPCNYGGRRAWWRCPCCGRRVALLYAGKVFACRQCHRLAYSTQRQAPGERACTAADKLRDKLKWEAGILNGNGGKPRWMHWRTFWKLQALHDDLVRQTINGMRAKLAKSMTRMADIHDALVDLDP